MNKEKIKLRASSSERWTRCPGSVFAELQFPEKESKYASEGTFAHSLAAEILTDKFDVLKHQNLDEETLYFVNEYVNYVRDVIGVKFYEQAVFFNNVYENGSGTADCISYDDVNKELHIIDLKFGMGVRVEAQNNTQLILYGIGALNLLKSQHVIDCHVLKRVVLHIVQPRLKHISVSILTLTEIEKYWIPYLAQKASEALVENAPRFASEKACKFCRAKAACPAIMNIFTKTLNTIKKLEENDMKVDKLTELEIKEVLDNKQLLIDFINNVESDVYDKLTLGIEVLGYRLKDGKYVRKYTDEAENVLVSHLKDNAYTKKLIPLTKAEKLVSKDIIEKITIKTQSEPVLVKDEAADVLMFFNIAQTVQ